MLSAFVRGSQDQLAILGTAFDWACDEEGEGALKEVRMPQIGYVLQFLYQQNVVLEEPCLEWEEEMRKYLPPPLLRHQIHSTHHVSRYTRARAHTHAFMTAFVTAHLTDGWLAGGGHVWISVCR